MAHADVLSRPLSLRCGSVLHNRIAKSAMSEVLADPLTGAPGDRLVRLYERWGKSGAGLLITGNVMVSQDGRSEVGNVVIEDDRHMPVLRRWANAAQAYGAQAWMQINHAGRQAPRTLQAVPVAPSAIPMRKFGRVFAPPRALEHDEIVALVDRYAKTASIAKEAGFAGVQIHGAHGYLVSQFLSPIANQRDDAWGGDPERRMRFLLEVVRATRAAVGPRFPVGVKLNSADFQRGGFSGDDAIAVVRALEDAGVDLVEISGGSYEAPAMVGSKSTRDREAYFLEYAEAIAKTTQVPILLTGGMRSAEAMARAIDSGAVDVVGIARPLAYEPDLPARLLDGSASRAASVDLHTGLKRVDDMLQIFWFQSQLARMASGRDPSPGLSKTCVLAQLVYRTLRFAA